MHIFPASSLAWTSLFQVGLVAQAYLFNSDGPARLQPIPYTDGSAVRNKLDVSAVSERFNVSRSALLPRSSNPDRRDVRRDVGSKRRDSACATAMTEDM
jgi:hypothetical protein